MIQITGLQFAYPSRDFRLQVPDLVIEAGRKTALIGPSGSGKTTLLNLTAGIGTPTAGRIITNGVEVSSLGEAARRDSRVRNIGLVFQEFELLEHLNVLDNILLPCRITPAVQFRTKDRDRAGELARRMGILDKLPRYPRKLSRGERQRVALCRALLLKPPLLLCDEPTGNLDPVYQYFQRRYGLNGKSVHWEPDEMPTSDQWSRLADLLKTHEAKLMIWEGEPMPALVTRLLEIGVRSAVFDPCANGGREIDYLAVMRENLTNLAEGLVDY